MNESSMLKWASRPARFFAALRMTGIAALFGILACGPSAGPSVATTTGDQPRYGGQLSVAQPGDPFDWDLTYNGKTTPNGDAMGLTYNSLVGFATAVDVKYNEQVLRPELAERWEVSPDAKTFTFYLRKGAKFGSPNGREVTSQDVKWSYEYQSRTGAFKDSKLPVGTMAFMFEGLDRVDTPDQHTVVVRFKDPFVPFLTYAGSDWNPVFPKEIYEQDGDLKNRMIGSGAFQLDPEASQKGSRWVFKKNPTYWDEGKPYLDEVRWLILPDNSTVHAAFRTKQLHWMNKNDLDLRSQQEIRDKIPEAVVSEFEYPAGGWLAINNRATPVDKMEVRKAMSMGIDRDEISQTLFGKKQPQALAGAFNGLFTAEEARAILKYDPAESKRLLAQAGYPEGLDLSWQYDSESSEVSRTIQQLIQAQLKKAGFNVNFEVQNRQTFSSSRRAGKYTVEFLTWTCGGALDDLDIPLYSCYHSQSSYNVHGVADPELDKILVAQRRETDQEKRRGLHRQAALHIADRAYGISLFYPRQWEAWYPMLRNYSPHAVSRASMPWHQVWLAG